jgi:3-isopropylmalate dehydrogenase
MVEKTIAVLTGDGIGPEIMQEAIKVLNAVSEKYDHLFNLVSADFGAEAFFKHGHPFPEETKRVCDSADAILKGPIGLDEKRTAEIPVELRPEAGALLPLRRRYDTFANFRPVKLPKALLDSSPLKPRLLEQGIDIMMIRELVGGIYFGEKTEGTATGMKYSRDLCEYTREQVERIAHVAFQEAERLNAKLTNVHKANVLATSRFWNSIVAEIALQYPAVKLESMLVDNVAFQLMINPAQFNGVMLLENMQGDILTDQAGGILGSLGLMPSACIGPKKAYFEPAHGSAPSIAGKNIANPYSMIGCIAFMLEKSFALNNEASIVWNALTSVFAEGYRTQELKTSSTPKEKIVSTLQFGSLVAERI